RIRDEHGSAVLLVSHDMAVITGMCSRVIVMYRGRIVEQLATTDLIAGRARHPYTRALLAAVPTMDSERGTPLNTIPEGAVFEDAVLDPEEPQGGELNEAADPQVIG